MAHQENELAFFYRCAGKTLTRHEVQQMAQYVQHGNTSTLTHCLAVAWYSYKLSWLSWTGALADSRSSAA